MSDNSIVHKSNAGNIFWGVFAIATVRDFLEVALEGKFLMSLSEPLNTLKTYFLHFNSFYFLVYVCLSLILFLFAHKNSRITDCFRIGAFAMILIWVGPLFDYCVVGEFDMFYPPDPMAIIGNIHHFADPGFDYEGLSKGMRVEILLAGIGAMGFIYYKTRRIFSSVLGGICISFACLSIGMLIPFFTQYYEYGFDFGYHKLYNSTLLHQGFVIHGTGAKIALFYILLCLVFFSIAYYIRSPKWFLAIVRNFRWTRTIHYLVLFFAGVSYIFYNHPVGDFEYLKTIWNHPFDLFGIFMASVAILLSFQSAVIFNDIYDYDIDVVSNPNRPLVSKAISLSEYMFIGKLFAILALIIAFCVSEVFFIFVLLYNLLAFLYSAPPFRLRQYYLVSNIELATIFIVTFHAGTTVLFSDYRFDFIPSYITFGLLLCFALALAVKDSKDYEGDKLSHIQTLHTMFGKKIGNVVAVILVCCAIILTPALLHLKQLWFFCVIVCIVFLLIIVLIKRADIKERLVVFLYFFFISTMFYNLILNNT